MPTSPDVDWRTARLALGEAAALCPTVAAQLYGGRPAELVPAWRRAGIVFTDPTGRERLIWGDVLRWARGDLGTRAPSRAPAQRDPWAELEELDPDT